MEQTPFDDEINVNYRLIQEGPTVRTVACPPELTWRNVAAQLVPPEQEAELVKHAASCAYCGLLLKEALHVVDPDISSEESDLIAQLKTSNPQGRDALIGELARVNRMTPWRKWAALAASVAVVTTAMAVWGLRKPDPGVVAARAYTAWRTTELRMPGARYAPLAATQLSANSALDRPKLYLESQAVIAQQLEKRPEDPEWLQAKGRAQLLAGEYDSALGTLRRAQDNAAGDSRFARGVAVDLATANFERARALGRPEGIGEAYELLSKVLASDPKDPVALFNRAIVSESMSLFENARQDLEKFLSLEPTGGWADEARRRLEKLKSKGQMFWSDPDAAPSAFLTNPGARPSEDYLPVAITKWLPTAAGDRQGSRNALQTLAELMIKEHADYWLADVLRQAVPSGFENCANAYAAAYQANRDGGWSLAEQKAREGRDCFQGIGNQAAQTGAAVEWITALNRQHIRNGLSAERAQVAAALGHGRYPWLLAQALIEQDSSARPADSAGYRERIEMALRIANERGYETLRLRILPFLSTADLSVSNTAAVWTRQMHGLARFWRRPHPPMRGFNLLWNLGEAAYLENRPLTALAIHREASGLAARTPSRMQEGIAQARTAALAALAGEFAEATERSNAALNLMSRSATDPKNATYRLSNEMYVAMMERAQGRTSDALRRLARLTDQAGGAADLDTAETYYQFLAETQRSEKNLDGATESLEKAAALAEQKLHEAETERDRLDWQRASGPVFRMQVALRMERSRDNKQGLESWERYRAIAESMQLPPARGDLEGALGRLGEASFIVYAMLDNRVAIWALNRNGIDFQWAPTTAAKAEDAADRFARECSDPNSSAATIERSGRELYSWLVMPVRNRLPARGTIVIEADGLISAIPFAALRDESGAWLGDRLAVVNATGFWAWAEAESAPVGAGSSRILAVGAPSIGSEMTQRFPPLPRARDEAQQVARGFSAAKLLTGPSATLAAILRELPEANVFHFAGHGLEYVEGGALLLAPGGAGAGEYAVLESSTLNRDLLRSCRLAVLSACSSGVGERRGNAASGSLVRAFLRAKTPNVVASRWNVDSQATSRMVDCFYKQLLAGESVAESLRSAGESIRETAGWSHPYYWAAFSAFGRG